MRTSSGTQDNFFILATCEIVLIELILTVGVIARGTTSGQVDIFLSCTGAYIKNLSSLQKNT